MKVSRSSRILLKTHFWVRKRAYIENIPNPLRDQLSISRVRARMHWGFGPEWVDVDKLDAYLLDVFLNQHLRQFLMKRKDSVLA